MVLHDVVRTETLPLDKARRVLIEELLDLQLSPASPIEDALRAADELLDVPRPRWPAPRGQWEQLVTALAVTTRRVQGALYVNRKQAAALTRKAAKELIDAKRERG